MARDSALNAGDLSDRVEIQVRQKQTDPNGQVVDIHSTTYFRWANVMPVSGTEGQSGVNQITADVTHLIQLRYDEQTRNITPLDRIISDGRELNIVRVYDPDGLRKQMAIQANERVKGF